MFVLLLRLPWMICCKFKMQLFLVFFFLCVTFVRRAHSPFSCWCNESLCSPMTKMKNACKFLPPKTSEANWMVFIGPTNWNSNMMCVAMSFPINRQLGDGRHKCNAITYVQPLNHSTAKQWALCRWSFLSRQCANYKLIHFIKCVPLFNSICFLISSERRRERD